MYTIAERVRQSLAQMTALINREPAIRPDFSNIDHLTLVEVMLAVIHRGNDNLNAEQIFDYLHKRGCPFDRQTIDFLLCQYDGHGETHFLWSRSRWGTYWAHP